MAIVLLDTGCHTRPQRRHVYIADDPLSEAMALLKRKETEDELGLTHRQREQIAALESEPMPTALLSLMDQAARDWRTLSGTDPEGQGAAREHLLDGVMQALWEWREDRLAAVLTTEQFHRYVAILLQVYGPSMLLRHRQVATDLGLSPEQLSELKRVASQWDAQIQPLRQALGRYAVTGYTELHSETGRHNSSPSVIATQIERVSRGKDDALLDVLSPEQRRAWRRALGKPVKLVWDAESVYCLP